MSINYISRKKNPKLRQIKENDDQFDCKDGYKLSFLILCYMS